ncbi:hypothetical protein C2G38_367912 [Gigaspora rosea]|uniref:Uncharacterized protein n=1 Tax=Gigaspora rosea TaxID=44941 RepID=A0A397VTT2_9GLOM|nr:hypothetical protein C2G38_367912 [Gigaspora rosea]
MPMNALLQYRKNLKILTDDEEKRYDVSRYIMPDMSLSKVRKLLEQFDDIYMSQNMKFLKINSNIPIQIISNNEECKVSEILDNNCIHILKDPTVPSFFQFINKHHLFRGRYFTSDMKVKIAQKDAFKLKLHHNSSKLELSNNECLTAYLETCKEEVKRIFMNQFISKTNISVPLAPYLLKFGINFEKSCNKERQELDSYEFTGVKCTKCSITISPDDVEPTEEFKDAINMALNQENDDLRLHEINKLSEKFGYFCKN